ncbi:MAG: peptidoglycan-associated lipoprotein Pal [Gemmatimonadetes bacterium]|nr:peptidoglycan-associated lipoprotein Pal [Gemmatimonadota bacterium]
MMRRIVIPVLALSLMLGACKKAPPPAAPAPTGPSAEELERTRQDSIARERARQEQLRAGEEARRRAEEERRRAIERTREKLLEMVFFDFDKYDIRADAERVLREKVEILRANSQVRLRLEGHADERGSNEYNLALGQRRADSVRQFLLSYGVGAERFATISYGEERPLVQESNEDAWARNRRVEFIITAGGEELVPVATSSP